MSANDKPVQASAADVEKLSAAIRFEKGNPSAEDVAAVVAVLAAAAGSAPQTGPDGPDGPKSIWGDNRERMRPQYFNGPNAFTSQTPIFWTKGS